MSAIRTESEGTETWKRPDVFAIWTGVPNVAPPSVDFATNSFPLPVSGQNAKTSPAELVLMSAPGLEPVGSAPLTCTGACPPDHVRRPTNVGFCQVTWMGSLRRELGVRSRRLRC